MNMKQAKDLHKLNHCNNFVCENGRIPFQHLTNFECYIFESQHTHIRSNFEHAQRMLQ